MKTAIYIEDGTVQLVLTPETDFEKNALGSFDGKQTTTQIYTGTFYDCRGGWVRQREYICGFSNSNTEDRSLIIRVNTSTPIP